MTEFQCSCHIKGKSYNLLTLGASTVTQAIHDFKYYVDAEFSDDQHSLFDCADGLIVGRVEVD